MREYNDDDCRDKPKMFSWLLKNTFKFRTDQSRDLKEGILIWGLLTEISKSFIWLSKIKLRGSTLDKPERDGYKK